MDWCCMEQYGSSHCLGNNGFDSWYEKGYRCGIWNYLLRYHVCLVICDRCNGSFSLSCLCCFCPLSCDKCHNANQGGVVSWLKLAPNPTTGSDQIMIGLLDAGADLNTFVWSGTAWSAVHTEHSAGTENAAVDMDFDITLRHILLIPNDAWLVWSNGTTVSRKLWDGGTSAWAAATTMGDDSS
jgi:hypothetical protein